MSANLYCKFVSICVVATFHLHTQSRAGVATWRRPAKDAQTRGVNWADIRKVLKNQAFAGSVPAVSQDRHIVACRRKHLPRERRNIRIGILVRNEDFVAHKSPTPFKSVRTIYPKQQMASATDHSPHALLYFLHISTSKPHQNQLFQSDQDLMDN